MPKRFVKPTSSGIVSFMHICLCVLFGDVHGMVQVLFGFVTTVQDSDFMDEVANYLLR